MYAARPRIGDLTHTPIGKIPSQWKRILTFGPPSKASRHHSLYSIRRRQPAIFYGLDWVATGPATFALTNQLFGRRDTPVIISWIFAAHQIGGALAAFGAGEVRSLTGDYLLAFMTSGLACLLASLLVLQVTRPAQRRCAV
jgi:hypothetical protein